MFLIDHYLNDSVLLCIETQKTVCMNMHGACLGNNKQAVDIVVY